MLNAAVITLCSANSHLSRRWVSYTSSFLSHPRFKSPEMRKSLKQLRRTGWCSTYVVLINSVLGSQHGRQGRESSRCHGALALTVALTSLWLQQSFLEGGKAELIPAPHSLPSLPQTAEHYWWLMYIVALALAGLEVLNYINMFDYLFM